MINQPFPQYEPPPAPKKKRHIVRNTFIVLFSLAFAAVLISVFVAMGSAAKDVHDGRSVSTAATNDEPSSPQYSPQVEQAREAAKSYLSFTHFSHDGLVHQLSSKAADDFPESIATQAVDSLTVDWNAQAVDAAKSYLEFTHFSCSGLIHQLSSDAGDKFTTAQATYGAHQTKACA